MDTSVLKWNFEKVQLAFGGRFRPNRLFLQWFKLYNDKKAGLKKYIKGKHNISDFGQRNISRDVQEDFSAINIIETASKQLYYESTMQPKNILLFSLFFLIFFVEILAQTHPKKTALKKTSFGGKIFISTFFVQNSLPDVCKKIEVSFHRNSILLSYSIEVLYFIHLVPWKE